MSAPKDHPLKRFLEEPATPYPALLLTPEDSKRVADAAIAAIEAAQADMVRRHDAMCAQMEANHWQAIQQRMTPNSW